MKYLDANFFIICNFDTTEKGKNARELLKRISEGEASITSALTIDEVMWVVVKNNKKSELRGVVEDIYSIPNMKIQEVGAEIPLIALEFIETANMKPRDAFHAAVMKKNGITEIVTDDADFDKVKGVKRVKF